MVQNPPAGTPQVYSRVAYRDPGAAIDWLTDAFGLEEIADARVTVGNGRVLLTEMTLGAGRVMVGGEGSHDLASPDTVGGRTQMVIAYVDGVDAHHDRAKAAGARIVTELRDQPWGDRRYEALDCEGHRWYFAEHVRDVPAEEWKAAIGSPPADE